MTINPILPFRAVVPGSAYPKTFTTNDNLKPASVEAKAALDLGCLNVEDAELVRKAHGLAEPQTDDQDPQPQETAPTDPKVQRKAQGAAPENKVAGSKD